MRRFILFSLLLVFFSGCKVDATTSEACGDGVLDPGEECDTGVGDQTCLSIGHYAVNGVLKCNPNCTLDRSDCGGRCGDGEVQAEYGELCDLGSLGTATCESLGYHGGVLACQTNCAGYDETDCALAGRCGDDVIQAGFGETCDGADLGGQTCEGLGYHGGALACQTNCAGFDESGCSGAGRCGDGVVQTAYGETCDGNDLDGETCQTQGFYGGALTCESDCSAVVLTDCIAVGRCGDGTVQSVYGETCDGDNLDGQSCQSLGYYGGALTCAPDCTLDLTPCEAAGTCGDELIQLTEECDGDNLDGQSCEGLGFYPGTLSCFNCALDDSGCGGSCGDGIAQSAHEDCDGSDLDGDTCRTRSYFTGTLACTGDCLADTSACVNIVNISAGAYHTCAVVSDGTVRCWGRNNYGQLGDNSTSTRRTPRLVLGITSAAKVAAGQYHTCVMLTDGTVRCWGWNSSGQLGDNTTTNRLTPVAVASLTGATDLTAGGGHTCVVRTDGTARCWGYNWKGQLGDGTTTNRRTPVSVSGLNSAESIVAGNNFTCSLRTDDTVRCWGQNDTGQLGNNTIVSSSVPVTVSGLEDVNSLTAGSYHACATTATNTLPEIYRKAFCWGDNDYGQLGDGTTTQRNIPIEINYSLSNTKSYYIFAGNNHTCMNNVLAGTYYYTYCWGLNSDGQLSDGTTTDRWSPVSTAMTGTRHALGGAHSCQAYGTTLNSMRCWGDNAYGQLGDGTITDSSVYVTVEP